MEKYNDGYVISAKLDGVSGLFSNEGGIPKLFTRGNGKIGQDISHLIPYLKLPLKPNVTIRGEFIIKKDVFDHFYKDKFSNPRNFVSGVINSKTISKSKINHIDFVAYEVIIPELHPKDQMEFLKALEVNVVLNDFQLNYIK